MFRSFNIVAVLAIAAVLITFNHAENCTEGEKECLTSRLLEGGETAVIALTSDPEPQQFCQRFQRTSISQHGNEATYNVTFREAASRDTPIVVNATLEVEGNKTLSVAYGNETEKDIQNILYIEPGNCFVGQSNRTGQILYLFKFVPGKQDDCSCIKKFKELSGGKVTVLRDQRICKDMSAQP
ncbi:uncharacterized protein LOC144134717 [Amblyomma americanum]